MLQKFANVNAHVTENISINSIQHRTSAVISDTEWLTGSISAALLSTLLKIMEPFDINHILFKLKMFSFRLPNFFTLPDLIKQYSSKILAIL